MTCQNMKPSSFISIGENIEVLFMNKENQPVWYKGIIKDNIIYGYDKYGTYVDCDIQYEDGEFVYNARFYDCDFNNTDSLDTWKFSNIVTKLIESLDETKCETKRELNDIKNSLCDARTPYKTDNTNKTDKTRLNMNDQRSMSKILMYMSIFFMLGYLIKHFYSIYSDYILIPYDYNFHELFTLNDILNDTLDQQCKLSDQVY